MKTEDVDKVMGSLIRASVGSCTCGVKTFQPEYHEGCPFKDISESIAIVAGWQVEAKYNG